MSRIDVAEEPLNPDAGKPASALGSPLEPDDLWVQVIDTEHGFDALEPTWTALYDDVGTSPFQTFAWQRAWWRHYGEPAPQMRLFVLVVRHCATGEESAVTAIAPFFIERRRVAGTLPVTRIELIGGDQSDYHDLLVQSATARASLAALATQVGQLRNHVDAVLLRNVPDHSTSFSPLLEALGEHGFCVARSVGEYCPRMKFGRTWEQTEQTLPPAVRGKTMRRKMRRLLERHGAELELPRDPARLDADLADLFALHQQRWTGKGHSGAFNTTVNTEFVREASRGLAARGQLVLAFLRLEGERVAGICGFRHGDVFHSYAAGLADAGAAARNSPGIALHLMLMKVLFHDGVRVYDQLRGTEAYKLDLGGVAVPTWRATAFGRPAGLGRIVYHLYHLQTGVRRRFQCERLQLRALRADPACGGARVRRHVAERLAANFTDIASRLRRYPAGNSKSGDML